MCRKIQGRLQKNDEKKTSIFQPKIDEKSMNKWVAAPFLAKIEKITALGSPFLPKIHFLDDSEVPWGTQKSPQRVVHIGSGPSWNQLGIILGSRSIVSRFWFPFWVPLGPIWGPSGLHFKKNCNEFFHRFLGLGLLAELVCWLWFLAVWRGWLGWLVDLIVLIGWSMEHLLSCPDAMLGNTEFANPNNILNSTPILEASEPLSL